MSDSEHEYIETQNITEREERNEHAHAEYAKFKHKVAHRSFDESEDLIEVREQLEASIKKNRKLTKELAASEARFEEEDVEGLKNHVHSLKSQVELLKNQAAEQKQKFDEINQEKRRLLSELKMSKAEVASHGEELEEKTTKTKQMEKKITFLSRELKELRETVSEFLGVDMSSTKLTRDQITTIMRENKRKNQTGGQVSDEQQAKYTEEVTRLQIEITRLTSELNIERTKPVTPSIHPDIFEAHNKEKRALDLKFDEERLKYLTLVSEVTMYRDASKQESDRLMDQLKRARAELGKIQTFFSELHERSNNALQETISASSYVTNAEQHRCEHSSRVFTTIEKTVSSESLHSAKYSGSSHMESELDESLPL